MDFDKPALIWDEQLELLRRRGMHIPDEERARHYLAHINYYRLRGYWIPLEAAPGGLGGGHRFRRGVSFDDVLSLYVFDREFRLLLLDAIERVEVSLRAQWAYHTAHAYGPHGYLDERMVHDRTLHHKHIARLRNEVFESKELFIRHYRKTYTAPNLPPVWAVSEVMSLGTLSRWIANMLPPDRRELARVYGLDQGVFRGFIHHLTVVRNLCAHHNRVWNRELTVKMPLPKTKPASLIPNLNRDARGRIYNTLVLLAAMLDLISPHHGWKARLSTLIADSKIDIRAMGFPTDWRARPIWTSPSGQLYGKPPRL